MRDFHNPHHPKVKKTLLHALLWMCGYYKDPLPPEAIPEDFSFPNPRESADAHKPKVTWVAHSTFLVEVGGISFLTDPIWSKRCSPLPFFGPKRLCASPFPLASLPKIDFVLISHNHYDHLDYSTLRALCSLFPSLCFIVPYRLKKWFSKRLPHAKEVVELQWGDAFENEHLLITSTPAQHFSGRTPFDLNDSSWMGLVVHSKILRKQFYFVGDTGYNPFDFKEIGKKFQGMDLSLIPIGAYLPRSFMKDVHIDPQEAVTIHQEVGSRLSVGGHFHTFRLSSEKREQPPFDLFRVLERRGISWEQFRVLDPGQTINW